jgi:hypothetical protein
MSRPRFSYRASPRTVAATPAVPAGAPGASDTPARAAHCRVLGVSRPVAGSEIRFEVAIPLADAWTGRYRQIGALPRTCWR